jgi:hypothetical protein
MAKALRTVTHAPNVAEIEAVQWQWPDGSVAVYTDGFLKFWQKGQTAVRGTVINNIPGLLQELRDFEASLALEDPEEAEVPALATDAGTTLSFYAAALTNGSTSDEVQAALEAAQAAVLKMLPVLEFELSDFSLPAGVRFASLCPPRLRPIPRCAPIPVPEFEFPHLGI